MKTRVIEVMDQRIKEAPDDLYLKKQRQLMNRHKSRRFIRSVYRFYARTIIELVWIRRFELLMNPNYYYYKTMS
ncbi:hypothetical protein OVA29_16580 [Exiguobacterium sp. SL14]|nr:hypothetical protein [Exiguobacterium sp. SL14]MCY1692034.1 hypothetical protein [Exiguobacterium sp. SL14]